MALPLIEGVAAIVISLSTQQLSAYNSTGALVYRVPVSTGAPGTPTPTGVFRIGSKYERTDLVGQGYRINLPHVQCLEGGGLTPDIYCIHPTPEGEETLGKPRSHGCVRTGWQAARWLFLRTSISTPVTINQ